MRDNKIPDSRGHTSPPPGLAGADLTKWIEENSSALMVSRDAQFSAKQQKIIEANLANKPSLVSAATVPEKSTIPIVNSIPEVKPIGGNQFDEMPLKMPGECKSYQLDSEINYRQIEGRRPRDKAELLARIESLSALDTPETKEWEVEFHIVRMVKGFFLYADEKAFQFHEEALQDHISIESFMSIWVRIKIPSWLIETLIHLVPMSWDHPCLDHFKGGKNRIRQLAGVSYRLQSFWGKQWFLMDQAVIAEVINRSQQDVSNCLKYLVDCHWLERRKMKGTRSNEYHCLVGLKDAQHDSETGWSNGDDLE